MPYDPIEFWQKLLKRLNIQKYEQGIGLNEWGFDSTGRRWPLDPRVSEKAGRGWDTSEVWKNVSPEGPDAGGGHSNVPDWMSSAMDAYGQMRTAGDVSDDELAGLYNHWVGGEGINPVWQAAYNAQPSWVADWLKGMFAKMGYGGGGGQVGGRNAQPQ